MCAGLAVGLVSPGAKAEPIGPTRLCEVYPSAPACATGPTQCTMCHISTDAESPTWNAFGTAVEDELGDADFDMNIADVLLAIDALDSDGDGFANGDEILAGSHPGDAESVPAVAACPDDASELPYTLCQYDPPFAYKRVSLDFCGESPTYDDMVAFRALSYDEQLDAIDEQLDLCLATPFWRGEFGVLWEMSYPKVRPVRALKAGRGPSEIENLRIADYYNDIMLYTWAQVDGNDARAVLTAEFFVLQDGLTFEVVDDIGNSSGNACGTDDECPANEECVDNACACLGGCAEGVIQERRRGLLTTRWNLLYNTMFTAIPRSTAAQAYRAFLGLDISKQEGLNPVPDEPVDYDAKGVLAPACAICHTTLDPLSYPFTTYTGFGPGPRATYVPDRMSMGPIAGSAPNISDTPESGVIFGVEVADLREWADVAADSPQFAQASVGDYWQRFIGRKPVNDEEAAEFNTLWDDFMNTYNYSVEAMLHDLVRTEAYGAP
ncbi:MAG: hypothetical protein AAF721_29005 [Myxococcota bacterium]